MDFGATARAEREDREPGPTGFHLMLTGQVESGQFHGHDNLYCKYSMTFGPDWKPMSGVDTGISQIARKASSGEPTVVWNFPVDMAFKSTNPHGWPRIVLSVYGVDALGRDVVRGYGAVHIPTTPGSHTRYVRMFVPMSSTKVQELLAWITGHPPEFYDAKFVGQGEGREVTRVRSTGVVKVCLNVTTRGLEALGYCVGKEAGSSVQ